MNSYIEELRIRHSEELAGSAREFLEIGFDLFHRFLESDNTKCLMAMNSLSTGLELTIKAFI